MHWKAYTIPNLLLFVFKSFSERMEFIHHVMKINVSTGFMAAVPSFVEIRTTDRQLAQRGVTSLSVFLIPDCSKAFNSPQEPTLAKSSIVLGALLT